MLLNFAVLVGVSLATPPPPAAVRELVERVRYPRAFWDEPVAGNAELAA
jgi:cation/acetate symporter